MSCCHTLGRAWTCGDHGFVGDGDSGIGGKDLTFLLFPCVGGKGEAQVDAVMEFGHVVIQIRLADQGVGVDDVHDEGVQRLPALRPLVGSLRTA
jgi:hypothetical protein